jgi:eukaryotic-like serine/threonine-protein kinase
LFCNSTPVMETSGTLGGMPASGDLLAGRYRILAPLGAGGMATVYRANDERLSREVAIKVLLPNLASDPVVAARFEREARTLAAAAHPGVVSIFDVDAGDPNRGREPFFVMELCPGGSLADRLVDGQRLTPDELIPTLVSVADGLADLHARGVVHRDVKPSNILFASDRAKLADFGLARSDDGALDDLTTPGTAVGTMAYLAPEVLAGDTATAAADIYALGVAAFAGLTGTLPRPAKSLTEFVATAREPARSVSAVVPELGRSFDEPITATLATDPGDRPDALDFASSMTAALGAWGRSGPVAAMTAPTSEGDLGTDATTTMAVPVQSMSAERAEQPADRRVHLSRRMQRASAGTVVAVLAAVLLWAVLASALRTGSSAPTAAPSASRVASASPSAVPSTSTAPPATPSVVGRALAALDEVDSAISATAGKDGLKGNERNDLERLAGQVRSALEDGDLDAAGSAAEELKDRIDELRDELDEERADRLDEAATTLVDILGGPD